MIKAILCSVQNSITLLPDFVDEEKGNGRGRVQAGHQTEVRHGVVMKFYMATAMVLGDREGTRT